MTGKGGKDAMAASGRDRTTCAVIPALNERATVYQVVKETSRFVDTVIVVDDHSRDGTDIVAKTAGAVVLKNGLEKGAHLATLYGLAEGSECDLVVTLDADGQHPSSAIPRLLEPLLADRADFVIGKRQKLPPSERPPRRAVSAIMGLKADLDVGSGFRAFRRELIRTMKPEEVGFCGCGSFLLFAWLRGNARIAEVEYRVLPRKAGKSRFSNTRKFLLHEQQGEFLTRVYGRTSSKRPTA